MTFRFLQKRQAFQPPEDGFESTTEGLLVEEPETGVTLGQILGTLSLRFLEEFVSNK